MTNAQFSQLKAYIWNIANDILVDVFEQTDYRKIIMPMLTLRRIDVLLEPTKKSVLEEMSKLQKLGLTNFDSVLPTITGYPFYNTSQFTMRLLKSETNSARLKSNFNEYLNGFNDDVLDIVNKYELRKHIDSLAAVDRLGSIIERFTSDSINLGTKPVLDDKGCEVLPALDNHAMGMLFEQLLRQFNESYAVTSAGRHFTPRDYVALLADVALIPVKDKIQSTSYTVYDGACGTGGILTEVQKRFNEIARADKKKVNVHIFGQELMPETYATCKADLMMVGEQKDLHYTRGNSTREIIAFGSTISQDGHPGETYDFCISNPPFGTSWKEDLKKWGDGVEIKKEDIYDPRFLINYGGKIGYSLIPDIGDPQMLFLANNISRVKETENGTRIVEIHNGSSLFTGDAGKGASNLRRYIIENDMLEAIIAMPENDFYNTGIGTYIWIVTNRKEKRRWGKVQLIDATEIKTPLRKNLGEKNCETTESDRKKIVKILTDFEETPQSKIFDNDEFGYWEITVERPLRLRIKDDYDLSAVKLKDKDLEKVEAALEALPADTPDDDWNVFAAALKLPASLLKKIRPVLTEIDPDAQVVEGECNPNLTDTEQVPFLYEGGIDAFMENEVLPYAPDAYINEDKTVIGYELSFTKYFYKPLQLRSREEITADIRAVEKETEGLLSKIINE